MMGKKNNRFNIIRIILIILSFVFLIGFLVLRLISCSNQLLENLSTLSLSFSLAFSLSLTFDLNFKFNKYEKKLVMNQPIFNINQKDDINAFIISAYKKCYEIYSITDGICNKKKNNISISNSDLINSINSLIKCSEDAKKDLSPFMDANSLEQNQQESVCFMKEFLKTIDSLKEFANLEPLGNQIEISKRVIYDAYDSICVFYRTKSISPIK